MVSYQPEKAALPPERHIYLVRDIPEADHIVRVPDGKYVAEFIGSESFWYRGQRPRVVTWFVIIEGSCKGERIAAYYNVKQLQSRRSGRSLNSRFSVGWRSNLTAHLSTLFPDKYSISNLPETIPEADMQGRSVLIETRTIAKTHDGSQRANAFHYSVVKAIHGWAE